MVKYWRRYLPYMISALLLSATDMPAATVTVTNENDSGAGSLRQAIIDASPGDTIYFAPSVTTVTLTSAELVIDKNLTITGPGANTLTVTAMYSDFVYFRIFNINSSTVTVSMSGMTISNAFTGTFGQGGAGIVNAGVLTLTDCTISNNSGGDPGGGGVLNDHGTMTITGCTISNNSVDATFGGGGVLNENGTMTIMGCTISNNYATPPVFSYEASNGGGISNHSGSLIITKSTISGNTSSASNFDPLFPAPAFAFGGGVDNSGSMTITNCTISGNSAEADGISSSDTGYGGGISNGGDLQITSSTITLNSATGDDYGVGGGINGFEPTRTDSNIIALNTALTGPDFAGAGGLQSTGYNVIGNNADAVINSQSTDQIGTPGSPIDPLLGPLADNGGPTFTHALQSGSPAINRGDPAAPPQDQRGYGRLGVPDVGAFEFNGIPPALLGNISTRSFVQTGDNVMIGGFIVQGSQTKRVIIRAIGPELTQHGVPDAMANPTLELHDAAGALIASNDNWQQTIIGGIITRNQRAEILASGHAPKDGRESAIIADLPPGNYTAIVRGVNSTTGVALAEVYDISGTTGSFLGNISTRSFVQTGDNVMIGGFIVQGTQPKTVIVRAIGPELTRHGVPDVLADPTLELHDETGALIASNDSWLHTIIGGIITANQVRDIRNSGHAPTDPRESAIIATLPPGNYTAIVRGVNETTGVALVEVYDLN
ncbi:MAG TPA: right-handed parallel beta-helix repeat-containing protein [Candidatus Udaeobacter sp.]|nr:right-handed parallel beta-helix repeat-containing protein [Candidatus Udaeobacter sp.]